VSKTASTDGIEKTESSDGIDIGSVLRHVERNLDVGLGTQVVDLGGENLGDDVDQAGRVGQVTVVETHLGVCTIEDLLVSESVKNCLEFSLGSSHCSRAQVQIS